MNTLAPQPPSPSSAPPEIAPPAWPGFVLSALWPCEVVLVDAPEEQTAPSKTPAELLADGQCEV